MRVGGTKETTPKLSDVVDAPTFLPAPPLAFRVRENLGLTPRRDFKTIHLLLRRSTNARAFAPRAVTALAASKKVRIEVRTA